LGVEVRRVGLRGSNKKKNGCGAKKIGEERAAAPGAPTLHTGSAQVRDKEQRSTVVRGCVVKGVAAGCGGKSDSALHGLGGAKIEKREGG